VVFFTLQPLVQGRSAAQELSDQEMSDSESRRRVKLFALRDVEYDFAAGKLDEDDYRSLKRELSAEALEALDGLEREERGVGSPALEAEIGSVREALSSGRLCVSCGYSNPPSSRFCSSCGSPVGTQVAEGEVMGESGPE